MHMRSFVLLTFFDIFIDRSVENCKIWMRCVLHGLLSVVYCALDKFFAFSVAELTCCISVAMSVILATTKPKLRK